MAKLEELQANASVRGILPDSAVTVVTVQWVRHFICHLAPTGKAAFLLANGSMSSNQSGEGEIRMANFGADLVDCMVADDPRGSTRSVACP